MTPTIESPSRVVHRLCEECDAPITDSVRGLARLCTECRAEARGAHGLGEAATWEEVASWLGCRKSRAEQIATAALRRLAERDEVRQLR